jgi:hypothetical protein
VNSRQRRLYAKDRWLTRTEADSQQTLVHWVDADSGGDGFDVPSGAIRKSARATTPAVMGLDDHSLHETIAASRRRRTSGRKSHLLILTLARTPKYECNCLVMRPGVILSIEQRQDSRRQRGRR